MFCARLTNQLNKKLIVDDSISITDPTLCLDGLFVFESSDFPIIESAANITDSVNNFSTNLDNHFGFDTDLFNTVLFAMISTFIIGHVVARVTSLMKKV